jgi:hypothetical protein
MCLAPGSVDDVVVLDGREPRLRRAAADQTLELEVRRDCSGQRRRDGRPGARCRYRVVRSEDGLDKEREEKEERVCGI